MKIKEQLITDNELELTLAKERYAKAQKMLKTLPEELFEDEDFALGLYSFSAHCDMLGYRKLRAKVRKYFPKAPLPAPLVTYNQWSSSWVVLYRYSKIIGDLRLTISVSCTEEEVKKKFLKETCHIQETIQTNTSTFRSIVCEEKPLS